MRSFNNDSTDTSSVASFMVASVASLNGCFPLAYFSCLFILLPKECNHNNRQSRKIKPRNKHVSKLWYYIAKSMLFTTILYYHRMNKSMSGHLAIKTFTSLSSLQNRPFLSVHHRNRFGEEGMVTSGS